MTHESLVETRTRESVGASPDQLRRQSKSRVWPFLTQT